MNFKHLHYFWAVAKWGGVARASERLHLTPQTLSTQLRQFEERCGVKLFRPAGKGIELTEAGRMAFSYADEMFSVAGELSDALRSLPAGRARNFRVGVSDAVPKSLAYRMLAPALAGAETMRFVCREGKLESLLADLALHRLDIVLADRPLPSGINVRGYNHRLGENGTGFFAIPSLAAQLDKDFPHSLHGQPLLLPGDDSALRQRLLAWFERQRIVPRVVGEFDDSGLMKAFGRAGVGVFPVTLAVRDEVMANYGVELVGTTDAVRESYFAISVERRVTHPAVLAIIEGAALRREAEAASRGPEVA
ncbi:transcriptional activator NhaR [Rhodocyclus tenuis]|uniref:Transcriptional activator NhaR n=2 Tax=Rhodocyclus TaxID=1064 RepID=A0A6L5JST6_RHOTE|nr:transcriptional activator NhaR [Rhodocyclus gracilis]MQY50279.1 transcriptional activator NhaR [Rhodocyclus gracilis]MRD71824.1 transcriptional activator NhaR [Rhodocyclus gracilis]NJA87782.1 transcriptional activator NhaR [Rhodocyclus gracilis]